MRRQTDARERFAALVALDPGGCHLWTGAIDKATGYGKFWYEDRLWGAHRAAYVLAGGCLTGPGDIVRHSCDNRQCVNPGHLLIGTQLDNMRDAVERGRTARGERSGPAKLTGAQVEAIRESSLPQKELARIYGICQSGVSRIRSRKIWAKPDKIMADYDRLSTGEVS